MTQRRLPNYQIPNDQILGFPHRLFGSLVAVVLGSMGISFERQSVGAGCREDVENIVGAALFALGHGAKGLGVTLTAVEHFRAQIVGQVTAAVQDPQWRTYWQEEQVYVAAQAEAVGRHAARLAAEEGRTVITKADLTAALMKTRGHLPIGGRWWRF